MRFWRRAVPDDAAADSDTVPPEAAEPAPAEPAAPAAEVPEAI